MEGDSGHMHPSSALWADEVIGWFADEGNRFLLMQRVDDSRLLIEILQFKAGEEAAERYPQLFLR